MNDPVRGVRDPPYGQVRNKLIEAVEILRTHRDAVVQVMTRYGYTDPEAIGGYLDRDLPAGS